MVDVRDDGEVADAVDWLVECLGRGLGRGRWPLLVVLCLLQPHGRGCEVSAGEEHDRPAQTGVRTPGQHRVVARRHQRAPREPSTAQSPHPRKNASAIGLQAQPSVPVLCRRGIFGVDPHEMFAQHLRTLS